MRINLLLKSLVVICFLATTAIAAIRHTPTATYPKIQDAINASSPGDTVVIDPGTHIIHSASLGLDTTLYIPAGLDITIRSTTNDPAETTIQGRFTIGYDARTNTYGLANPNISGLTIEGRYAGFRDGCDGAETGGVCDSNYPTQCDLVPRPVPCNFRHFVGELGQAGQFYTHKWEVGDANGQNGWPVEGGGMYTYSTSSPIVTNCVFYNCSAQGRNGGNGTGEGWGGWAGWAYGGAVYIGTGGSPEFKNCDFIDCNAVGGDGGDGQTSSPGGRGGSWGSTNEPFGFPHLGTGWRFAPAGGYKEIWRYSGLGGAVYCAEDSRPRFDNCNFVNNQAYGGSCGESDETRSAWPQFHWQIPRYGGAVFIAEDSVPDFNNCTFIGNEPNSTAAKSEWQNHTDARPDNPYIGIGGAVAYVEGSIPKFTNCEFNGNDANMGGAIFSEAAEGLFSGCTIINNTAQVGGGIASFDSEDIIADGSVISGNRATIAGSGGGGVYILGGNVQIVDTEISNNTAMYAGGGVYVDGSETALLRNCLITGNQSGHDGAGVSSNWGSITDIINCTIAENIIPGTNGLGGGVRAGFTGVVNILNSILWDNSAAHGNQIAIGSNGLAADVEVDYSDVEGGAAGVYFDTGVSGSHLDWDYGNNLTGVPATDPLFESGYYLKSTSPCVDAGNLSADDPSLHIYRHTTRKDGKLDGRIDPEIVDQVDIGYHYLRIADIAEDFVIDGLVNGNDYSYFIDNRWAGNNDCSFPDWCDGRDLNQDGQVSSGLGEPDFIIFTANWMDEDGTPPNPNPMTWATTPYYISSPTRQVKMTATDAFDNASGTNVEYYFIRTDASGVEEDPIVSSGWQDSNSWTDTSVAISETYGYKVRARDTSFNSNIGQYSVTAFVNTSAGITPSPATQTWATTPRATSSTQIRMVATTATAGTAGVQYLFDCVSGAGHDSGWQDSTEYIDGGLTPSTSYSYRVHARNAINQDLTNAWSSTLAAVTDANGGGGGPGPDVNAPTPDPMTFSSNPHVVSQSSISMTASLATDPSGGIEYYFDCVTNPGGGTDSGWRTSRTYTDTGLTGKTYSYQVRARDGAGNITGWSPVRSATIDRSAPTPDPMQWASFPSQNISGGSFYHTMTCVAATDATGPVQYRFICVDYSAISSGWQTSTTYTAVVGGSHSYRWQVQAKDALGNETDPIPTTVWVQ